MCTQIRRSEQQIRITTEEVPEGETDDEDDDAAVNGLFRTPSRREIHPTSEEQEHLDGLEPAIRESASQIPTSNPMGSEENPRVISGYDREVVVA